jgi:hypothetical protein
MHSENVEADAGSLIITQGSTARNAHSELLFEKKHLIPALQQLLVPC